MQDILIKWILPLPGVELFTERDGRWYRWGEQLPAFGVLVPDDSRAIPLERILLPKPVSAQRPESVLPARMRFGVVRDQRCESRSATALCCRLSELHAWAGQATSAQFAGLCSRLDRRVGWSTERSRSVGSRPARGAAGVASGRPVLGNGCLGSTGLSGRSRPCRARTQSVVGAGPARSGRFAAGRVRVDRSGDLQAAEPSPASDWPGIPSRPIRPGKEAVHEQCAGLRFISRSPPIIAGHSVDFGGLNTVKRSSFWRDRPGAIRSPSPRRSRSFSRGFKPRTVRPRGSGSCCICSI